MKIILDDFSYRGYYFEHFEFEIPNVENLEDVTEDLLFRHVVWDLEELIDFNESFYHYLKTD